MSAPVTAEIFSFSGLVLYHPCVLDDLGVYGQQVVDVGTWDKIYGGLREMLRPPLWDSLSAMTSDL